MRVVTVPGASPAGTSCTATEEMAAGAELVAATPTEVAGRGWPVTTPRELVWVRKEVNPLV